MATSITVSGRLTKDPVKKRVGDKGAAFIVIADSYAKDAANFIPVWVRGEAGKALLEHGKKGSYVVITQASISSMESDDKDFPALFINAWRFEFGGKAPGSDGASKRGNGGSNRKPANDAPDDYIPF